VRRAALDWLPGTPSTLVSVPPDFLNSREDAVLVWGVLFLTFAISKNPREILAAALATIRAFFHPKLLLLYGSAVVYLALAVWTSSALGLWHASALKVTIYWFLGVAMVLVGNAVTALSRTPGNDLVWRALKRVVAATVIVEFLVNLYALPLAFELVAVFVVALFVGMQVVARHDPSTNERVLTFINGVLATVGLLYISYSLVRVLSDLDGFVARERIEDLLVPLGLTVVLLPFLLAAAWLSRVEQERLRRRWRSPVNAPS
jgi:hypothetical protein